MLFGLAEQGDAPKALMKLTKNGVPRPGSGCVGAGDDSVRGGELRGAAQGVELLFALVVALMINWALISLTHLKFRKAMAAQGWCPRSRRSGRR